MIGVLTKLIQKLIFVFLGTLSSLVLIELMLYISDTNISIYSEWQLGSGYRIRNSKACVIKPDFLEKVTYTRGGREKIIVAMGDSFTEGYPSIGKGFPEYLQAAFDSEDRDIKVLNFGIGDSGPDQQLRIFEELVLPSIIPDIVLWSFFPNDPWDNFMYANYTLDSSDTLKKIDCHLTFLYVRDLLDDLPLPQIVRKSLSYKLLLKSTEWLSYRLIPQSRREQPHLWGKKKLEREILKMQTLSQAYGFKLYLINIASQRTYLNNADDRTAWTDNGYQLINEAMTNTRIQDVVLDLNFKHIEDLELPPAYETTLFTDERTDPYALLGTRHFNENGYKIFADVVYRFLSSKNVL